MGIILAGGALIEAGQRVSEEGLLEYNIETGWRHRIASVAEKFGMGLRDLIYGMEHGAVEESHYEKIRDTAERLRASYLGRKAFQMGLDD